MPELELVLANPKRNMSIDGQFLYVCCIAHTLCNLLIKRDDKNTRGPNLCFALTRNVSAMHCLKLQIYAFKAGQKAYMRQWGWQIFGRFDFVIIKGNIKIIRTDLIDSY